MPRPTASRRTAAPRGESALASASPLRAAPPTASAADAPRAGLADHLAIMRLDHATKHVFVLPGALLAWLLRGPRVEDPVASLALGLLAAVALASANYVINEYLDREFDRFHPEKRQRVAVQRRMSGGFVVAQWAALLAWGWGWRRPSTRPFWSPLRSLRFPA